MVRSKRSINARAAAAGLLVGFVTLAGIYFGSRGLKHFDPAVTSYAVGTLLAAFAVGYRFTVWAQRPPSRMYFKRGLQLLLAPNFQFPISNFKLSAPAVEFPKAVATNFVAQTFIKRRSVYRWIMHLCLSGGCTLAFAITFPLVFGWIHFEALPDNAEIYRTMIFGLPVDQFSIHSAKAILSFNLLNFSALIVLAGLAMAGLRRFTDAGERAVQKFAEDILPLLLIFAVTATGLMLTVSYKFLAGSGHGVVAIAHAAAVIALLLYIPFGKLFHMFQRTSSLCVSLYKKAGATAARAHCHGCGEDFASQMHVDDLKIVLDQLGFNYRYPTVHYQDICPACRRKLLALNQGRAVGK